MQSSPPNIRFGAFELNLRARQLRKHGTKIKLHGQPFRILTMLLERQGEVVTREEMRGKLWPAGTFVDFDHSLNTSIKKLRQALGDSAEEPRYIETLPRLGYRFVGPVETAAEPSPQDVSVGAPRSRSMVPEATVVRRKDAMRGVGFASLLSRFGSRRWKWGLTVAAATGLMILAAVLILRVYMRPVLGETDFVLVSDFVNTTGEPVFDGTLKRALTLKLAESPYFNLLSDTKVRETLSLMGRSPDQRVVPPIARDVCQRGGAKVVVVGSILALGNKYVIDLDAKNCLTGSSLAHEETEAQSKEQVLRSLGRAIPPLRRKLGELLSSIQKFDVPIEQATTTSLAALKAYTTGDETRAQGQEGESIPLFKMAINLDPNFALAYARLGAVYRNIGEGEADQYLRKAFERREHVSGREKFYIEAHYYIDATREIDKGIETYRLWTLTYPRDWIPFNNLANEYSRIGQPDKAVEAGREALRLNPEHGLPYAALANAYLRASRFAEARAVCEKAIAKERDGFGVHFLLFRIAFVEGDESAMQREAAWFKGKPLEAWNLNNQAWAAVSLGELRRGRELFQSARSAAMKQGLKDYAASAVNDEAQLEADLGMAHAARANAERGLRLTPDSLVAQAGGAFALARTGNSGRAQALAKQLSRQSSLDTLRNNVTLPCIRAALEMNRKNPAAVIEELRRSAPYDLSNPGDVPDAATAYYRGLAYLQLGSGKSAATEFQKILDNRGVVAVSPYWPLSHLGLARALALSGDTEKSLVKYREFIALWRNADPDLPILKEARTEYAGLSAHSP